MRRTDMHVRRVASDKYLWEPVTTTGSCGYSKPDDLYTAVAKHIQISRKRIVWSLFMDWLGDKFGR